jgi:acyl carrier protein
MTREKIKDIIKQIMQEKINIPIDGDSCFQKSLVEIGLNSLLFIKLLVNIEIEINIEFEEEFLNPNFTSNLEQLVNYIDENLKS